MQRILFSLAFAAQIFLLSLNSPVCAVEGADTDKDDDVPLIDESIKIRVEPTVIGQLIDRVTEPATIFVDCRNAKAVSVYLEPVDAPYGGKSLAEPKLIGTSKDAKHFFPILWNSVEPYPYVKLFAICTKKENSQKRSSAIDLGLSGQRLKQQAVHEEKRAE